MFSKLLGVGRTGIFPVRAETDGGAKNAARDEPSINTLLKYPEQAKSNQKYVYWLRAK